MLSKQSSKRFGTAWTVGNRHTCQSEKTQFCCAPTDRAMPSSMRSNITDLQQQKENVCCSVRASNARPESVTNSATTNVTTVVTHRQNRFKCSSLIIQSNVHDAPPGSSASKNAQRRNKTSKSSARKMYAWKTFVLTTCLLTAIKLFVVVCASTDAEWRCLETEVSHGDTPDRPLIIIERLKRE